MDNKKCFLPSSYTFPCLFRAVRSKLFSRPFWPQTYQMKNKRIKNHTLIIQYLNIKDSHYLHILMFCVLQDDSLKSPRRRMAAEQPESERCILMTGVLFTCRLSFISWDTWISAYYVYISYSFSMCELVPDGRTCSIVSCLHSRVHLWEKHRFTPLSKSHWLQPAEKESWKASIMKSYN